MSTLNYESYSHSGRTDYSSDEDEGIEPAKVFNSQMHHHAGSDSADEYGPGETASSSSGVSPNPLFSNMYEQSSASHDHVGHLSNKRHYPDEDTDEISGNEGTFADNRNTVPCEKKAKYSFDECAVEMKSKQQIGSRIARNIMKKYGYVEGKGLGTHEQGITAPIDAAQKLDRKGLGCETKTLAPENIDWDDMYEEVTVEEYPEWLQGDHLPTLSEVYLCEWVKQGPKVMEMDSFTDFAHPELLHYVLKKKTEFDNVGDEQLRSAVRRSNPYECIGSGIFLNRAAMKMANMDRVFDYMFTEPVDRHLHPIIGERDLLYFADVCAGPGGFSEYVLWKKGWQAKGIGFTLKNECDFKLENFLSGTPETFETYYGVNHDGDIYDPDNIASLTDYVMAKTDNIGVHFMMADGGFSVSGKENIQELLSKRLYLCQFLVALAIVRTDGHFVCKLFDIFSPFSVGLVYLMYKCFQKISIHKPNTSRPANSERYIICKHKRSDCADIRAYLFKLNKLFDELGPDSDIDITECVPMSEMKKDEIFYNYIKNSNEKLGRRQVLYLSKVIVYCKNNNLNDVKQADIRKRSLDYWGVPDTFRRTDSRTPDSLISDILGKDNNCEFAANPVDELTSVDKLEQLFPSILDWVCVPVTSHSECNFYLGARNKVYELRKNGKSWVLMTVKLKLELSPGTLVYGEITEDLRGTYKSQRRLKIFHIIDAFQLGKKKIMSRCYKTRLDLCKVYAKALHKGTNIQSLNTYYPSNPPPIAIRVNDAWDMKSLSRLRSRIDIRGYRRGEDEIIIGLKDELGNASENPDQFKSDGIYYFPVRGILFYKTTKNPWHVHFSKRYNKIYYYQKGKESVFKEPPDITASSLDCFMSRRIWTWIQGVGIKGEPPQANITHIDQLIEFINKTKGY